MNMNVCYWCKARIYVGDIYEHVSACRQGLTDLEYGEQVSRRMQRLESDLLELQREFHVESPNTLDRYELRLVIDTTHIDVIDIFTDLQLALSVMDHTQLIAVELVDDEERGI